MSWWIAFNVVMPNGYMDVMHVCYNILYASDARDLTFYSTKFADDSIIK